jgi:hypothetical protein
MCRSVRLLPLRLVRVQGGVLLQLSSLLANYQARNVTTVYENNYPVWQVGGWVDIPPKWALFQFCSRRHCSSGHMNTVAECGAIHCCVCMRRWHVLQGGNGNTFTVDARIRIPPNQVHLYRYLHDTVLATAALTGARCFAAMLFSRRPSTCMLLFMLFPSTRVICLLLLLLMMLLWGSAGRVCQRCSSGAGCSLLAQLASTQGEAEGTSCGPLGETAGDRR